MEIKKFENPETPKNKIENFFSTMERLLNISEGSAKAYGVLSFCDLTLDEIKKENPEIDTDGLRKEVKFLREESLGAIDFSGKQEKIQEVMNKIRKLYEENK